MPTISRSIAGWSPSPEAWPVSFAAAWTWPACTRCPRRGSRQQLDVNRYRRAAEHDYRGRLAALAADSGQDVHRCHVEGGAIERVADRLAASCAADLVVVGTSARAGINRFIVGNTAETLLTRIDERDLLMVALREHDVRTQPG
ncbi:MAG: universal stress protein [Pseudomonadales bacterium]